MKTMWAFTGCVLALLCATNLQSAEGGKKRRDKDEKTAKKERAMLGDPIGYAIAKADELSLSKEQVAFLKELKKKMLAEREKDKDEQNMRQVYTEAEDSRKKDPAAARAQRLMYKTLADQQAQKWEEREMKELEKILPKDKFAKLKQLRGEVETTVENPFESN